MGRRLPWQTCSLAPEPALGGPIAQVDTPITVKETPGLELAVTSEVPVADDIPTDPSHEITLPFRRIECDFVPGHSACIPLPRLYTGRYHVSPSSDRRASRVLILGVGLSVVLGALAFLLLITS